MRRGLAIGLGAAALVVVAIVAAWPEDDPAPPVLVTMVPEAGRLPRDFMALARFDAPLDTASVEENLVYRRQQEDGSYGPPRRVADFGRFMFREGGRTFIYKIREDATPPVGFTMLVEFTGVRAADGTPLEVESLEYVMTADDPRVLYERLLQELDLADLAAIWREWMGSL